MMPWLSQQSNLLLNLFTNKQVNRFCCRGLLLDQVLINLLRVYMDPGNLILVLNYSEAEESYYKEKLSSANVHSVTFSTSISER